MLSEDMHGDIMDMYKIKTFRCIGKPKKVEKQKVKEGTGCINFMSIGQIN